MTAPINPDESPAFTREFLKAAIADAPPGRTLDVVYLGSRQIEELTGCRTNPSASGVHLSPMRVMGVSCYQVDVESHVLFTYSPSDKEKVLRDLLDYCDKLDTCQDCPPQFLDIVVMADRVRGAYKLEVEA